MSATTSRGYPYPTLSDDVDIPGDMSSLAAAVDTDVQAIVDSSKSVYVEQTTGENNQTSITYITGANVCGLTFVAPPSGAVKLWLTGRFQNDTSGRTTGMSLQVAAGATIGSGSVISAAADASALECGPGASDRIQATHYRRLTGLSPGSTYNVVVMYRVINGAGTCQIYNRKIEVEPYLSI